MGNVKENMKQIKKVEFEKVFEWSEVKVESQYNNLISGLGSWLDGGEISETMDYWSREHKSVTVLDKTI